MMIIKIIILSINDDQSNNYIIYQSNKYIIHNKINKKMHPKYDDY